MIFADDLSRSRNLLFHKIELLILPDGPSTSGASSSGDIVTRRSHRTFAESDIQRLVGYGFSRQQVIDELTKSNGNVDQALASLFAKSFQMP
jgi:hypothetical protein